MNCFAHFPCYPRPTPWLEAMVTNGLPCIFSLLSTPYSGVGGHGYKLFDLHLLPDITALPRGWTPLLQVDCLAHFPRYPRPILSSEPWLQMECPALSLLSPPYPGDGSRGYKWIALHLFPKIPALTHGWGPW